LSIIIKPFIIYVKAVPDAMQEQALGAEPVRAADGTAVVALAAGDTAAVVQVADDIAVAVQVAGGTVVVARAGGAEQVADVAPALPAVFPGNYLQDVVQVH